MTKTELIACIQRAFHGVTLADGIGLWEAQGLDGYADAATIIHLRKLDERDNRANIPLKELARNGSSLSFFDPKGMRFCLPAFLLYDLQKEELNRLYGFPLHDSVVFTLCNESTEQFSQSRFSLFHSQQIQCVIAFLEFQIKNSEEEESDIQSGIAWWKSFEVFQTTLK